MFLVTLLILPSLPRLVEALDITDCKGHVVRNNCTASPETQGASPGGLFLGCTLQ